VHEAGEPILTLELHHLTSGAMMSVHDTILTIEGLLKEKDPNFPVFMVKVPNDVDFVHEAPADQFFIVFEDVLKMFLSKWLDYNLVHLYALNVVMKIKREKTPQITIVDPYYMCDNQLVEGLETQTTVMEYLQKFMVTNKRKDTLLLPFFPK
jgi:hypothetical protein